MVQSAGMFPGFTLLDNPIPRVKFRFGYNSANSACSADSYLCVKIKVGFNKPSGSFGVEGIAKMALAEVRFF